MKTSIESLKPTSHITTFKYTYDAVTIPENSGVNISPNNYNTKPTGYSAIALRGVATGNGSVIVRGLEVVYGNLYVYNVSNAPITTTPEMSITLIKNEYF